MEEENAYRAGGVRCRIVRSAKAQTTGGEATPDANLYFIFQSQNIRMDEVWT